MQRKDYQLIADAIVATQQRIKADDTYAQGEQQSQLRGVRRTAAHLADALGSTNPRFDKTRFLKACGYGATTMNPRDPALDLRPLPEEKPLRFIIRPRDDADYPFGVVDTKRHRMVDICKTREEAQQGADRRNH